jgi:hydroxymethylbilane synthase
MNVLRVGTRGSDLARIQTRWVCDQLRLHWPEMRIEEVLIATHGDRHPNQPVTDDEWPMGGFTSSIERALIEGQIDLAVHSLKDMPVVESAGTVIGAIPVREEAHDVLVTSASVTLETIPSGLRIGTSSPRRTAQLKRVVDFRAVQIRGNVPSRLARIGADLDGVILAAAGLNRLQIRPAHAVNLPIDRFVPAPGQGALAVQVRTSDHELARMISVIDHCESQLAVTAERSLLSRVGGGCAAPIGAHAVCRRRYHHAAGPTVLR